MVYVVQGTGEIVAQHVEPKCPLFTISYEMDVVWLQLCRLMAGMIAMSLSKLPLNCILNGTEVISAVVAVG